MTRKNYEDCLADARARLLVRATRLVGEDAEDLLGDCYCHMLARADWESILKPANYMLGVLDYSGLAWRRKRAVRNENEFIGDPDLRSNNDSSDLADAIIAHEDLSDQIAAILKAMESAGLSSHEEYIVLARMRDEEYDEIASRLGLGRESCVTYYSNAICKIRKNIQTGEKQ